jgi:hypothetical protein
MKKLQRPVQRFYRKLNLQKLYQLDQLWFELYNKEFGEGLADMKNDGVHIEKF